MVRDPRKARYSRLFSPLPELMKPTGEMTPVAVRSSKFMGSPPAIGSSNLPRQHGAIALQRKPVVWSPLKLRAMMKANRRPSLLPSRTVTDI